MTVQALRRGRPEVLADLLDRYGRDMQAVAYLIVRDRAAAEDIVADSLLRPSTTVGVSVTTMPCDRGCSGSPPTRRFDIASAPPTSSISGRKGAVAEPRGPTADDSLALWQAVRGLPPRMRAASACATTSTCRSRPLPRCSRSARTPSRPN